MNRLLRAVPAGALLLVLAACGGGSSEATDDAADAGASAAGGAAAPQGFGGGMAPGATGTIAAVDGTTLQVQNEQSGQVAVTYDATTTITDQVAGAVADVTVGSCVRITSDDDASTGAVTATAVVVTAKVDGSCQAGPGRAGGPGGPDGRGGTPPDGAPTDLPSDLPSDGAGGFGGMRGVSGEVSATASGGFTVEASSPGSDETTAVEVTTTGDTAVTTTEDADASALSVGRCVTATGEADSTGAVAATALQVSDPVDGACGFGPGRADES